MEQEEKEYAIYANLERVGSLWFDIGTKISFKYYIVVGVRVDGEEDPEKTYYILVVLKTQLEKECKRLGVGEVKAPYVLKKGDLGKLL
jgi:hypothetical protein